LNDKLVDNPIYPSTKFYSSAGFIGTRGKIICCMNNRIEYFILLQSIPALIEGVLYRTGPSFIETDVQKDCWKHLFKFWKLKF